MTENPPISKEVKEFNFRLRSRLKVFGHLKVDKPTNLLAAASKYGVLFVGTPTGVQCLKTESILSLDVDHRHTRNISSYPKRNLHLGVQPSHLCVSADNELLAVALIPNDCAALFVYSVSSFGSVDVVKKNEVRLSNTPGVTVSDLQWNPGMANILAVVMSDGSAAVIEFKDSSFIIVGSIPQNSQASCLCWSPKGKQVVIGAKNGSLTQYKPELKAMKTFPPPQLQGTIGVTVVSVHWLSSFQFIAVYRTPSDASAKASVIVVNVPKNMPTKYVNYEDLCFGSNTYRPEHFFIHQPAWNVLIVGTTNSMEANILGMDGDNWVPWILDDGGRAELPLTDDHQDVYNIGMGLDISSTQPVPIGENLSVNPMPLLVMLSDDGVLCFFQAINTLQGSPNICQPPQPFPDSSGLHLFNLPEAGDATSLPGPAREETKVPVVKEPGGQFGQTAQPSLPGTVSSSPSFGKPFGLAGLSQSSGSPLSQVLPPFGINFAQPSVGQSTNFSQAGFASTSVNQSLATPVSKFPLAPTFQGQANSGQSVLAMSGLGLSQPTNLNFQQSTFSSGGGGNLSQPTWPTELSQRTSQKLSFGQSAAVSLKQPSPVQASLSQPQSLISTFHPPQSNLSPQQSVSVSSTPQHSLPNLQASADISPSQGNSLLKQLPTVPNTSDFSTLNLHQPNQENKTSQIQSQISQPTVSTAQGQQSSHQAQQSKLTPVIGHIEFST